MDNNNQQQKALKSQEALSVLLFKLVTNTLIVFLLYVLANLFIDISFFQTYLTYLGLHLIYNVTKMIKNRWK
jgi:hypothetical protein